MAIEGFKDIINDNGYKVDEKDRVVFEEGLQKSYFGQGIADVIEFVLYDSNDNKLPQGDSGDFVRYVYLDSANITDYFILSTANAGDKQSRASEYIVDVEKLIRDAGYSNGVFKTQVTLLNRRAGSNAKEGDKLWIHEISPSRTEIRVLPLKSKIENKDLTIRYDGLIEEKEFRDDTVYFILQAAESVTVDKIRQTITTEKGTVAQGEKYIKLIQQEFKIPNFEAFLVKVREKFLEACKYYAGGRYYFPTDNRYGKPMGEDIQVILPIDKIKGDMISILIDCLESLLPKRNIQDENILTEDEQKTLDELKEILKSSYNDDQYSSTALPEEVAVVGCMDPKAKNFNPLAKREDGSCVYEIDDPKILGCTDSTALNFNSAATEDDGSCKYEEQDGKLLFNQKYYVHSFKATYEWKSENGSVQQGKNREFDSFSLNHFEGTFKTLFGDIRTYPKAARPKACRYKISHSQAPQPPAPQYQAFDRFGNRTNMGSYGFDPNYTDPFSGQMIDDINIQNQNQGFGLYQPNPQEAINMLFGASTNTNMGSMTYLTMDSQVDIGAGIRLPLPFTYKNELGTLTTSAPVNAGSSTTICAEEGSVQLPNGNFSMEKLGDCTLGPIDDIVIQPDLPDINTIPIGVGGGSSGGSGGGGGSMQFITEQLQEINNNNEFIGDFEQSNFRNQNFY
jgi:hypothetical protein